MAIEIVDIPIKNGDFPVRVSLPEGIYRVYIYIYIYVLYIYTYIYICIIYIYIYVYTNVTESVPFHRKGDGHTLYAMRLFSAFQSVTPQLDAQHPPFVS